MYIFVQQDNFSVAELPLMVYKRSCGFAVFCEVLSLGNTLSQKKKFTKFPHNFVTTHILHAFVFLSLADFTRSFVTNHNAYSFCFNHASVHAPMAMREVPLSVEYSM